MVSVARAPEFVKNDLLKLATVLVKPASVWALPFISYVKTRPVPPPVTPAKLKTVVTGKALTIPAPALTVTGLFPPFPVVMRVLPA